MDHAHGWQTEDSILFLLFLLHGQPHQESFVDKILITLALLQTFQNKRLAHAVKESTLDSLITELLLWLLDERVPHMDDGSQLLKALNVLMLKILVKIYPKMPLFPISLRYVLHYCDCAYRTMQIEPHPLLSLLISCIHWIPLDGLHLHQVRPLLSGIRSSLTWL